MRLLPSTSIGEGSDTAFEQMHQLGLKSPNIEERDSDVLVALRREPLATPVSENCARENS
jgi:ATP-dependent DNA helicase RecG